jgi:outer membrane protein assembly factor BamA
VELDSVRDDGDGLRATIVLNKGPFTRIDSVVVRGNARVNQQYLQGRLGIQPGDPYDERAIDEVQQRVREMPFVTQKQKPYVLFTQDQTKLYLFLDGKRASSVNGILGVQPDPASGKVNFTGDLDLRLRNALHRGEAIDLNWRSLQDKTQDLKLRLDLPYLFRTPFGTDLSLKLFKRDTTFLEVNARAAIDYLHGRNDRVGGFLNSKSSERLGRQDIAVAGLADVHLTSYGLNYERERFDYRFNPRSGSSISLEGSAGRKRTVEGVVQNGEIPPTVESDQYEWAAHVIGHIRIGGRGTVRLVAQGEGMVNDKLYTNELFRVGGIKSLRGVDEASILASSYVIGTVEMRFILEENSNAFVFFDQAWWEDQSAPSLITDTPYGFGAGTSFETKAGIFMLTYALGSGAGRPLDLRESKVHFGFTSLF